MLKCDGITKVYGKKTVLSNFSMEFGAGVYGVLGPCLLYTSDAADE